MAHPPRRLRLSVTDRCNYRCRYCLPPEGTVKVRHEDLLSLEDLAEVAGWLCGRLRLKRVKLTGGEPLVRGGIEVLIGRLGRSPGIEEVSLITNGALLARRAAALKAAGLARVSVSLDSLDAGRYRELTRGGVLDDALRGIAAAEAAGLGPIKLNAVLQRSTWRLEAPRLLDFAAAGNYELRFIELMRTGTEREWCENESVDAREVRRWLEHATGGPVTAIDERSAPAKRTVVRWAGTEVAVGWISPRSEPFCASCDRLRMDARGRVHRCLMDQNYFHLAERLKRDGDAAAEAALAAYLAGKCAPVRMERAGPMVLIGG